MVAYQPSEAAGVLDLSLAIYRICDQPIPWLEALMMMADQEVSPSFGLYPLLNG